MVKSMYNGVSGLRAHQARMDTIGDNIANVNTYGFKGGRTTFRDIYYQQTRGASQPSAAQGGVNPSSVGYGSKVGSVDVMMSRSTFAMTDQSMDMAIDGEGFFQVQDAAGNTYYTRAGMINFDSSGNLVDMQGNYVLGVNGDPAGRGPSSERIAVSLGPVPPKSSAGKQTINGKEFTITTSNDTSDGNMNFSFTTDSSLADGDVVANLSASGIVIKMNPENTYSDIGELNDAINAAILKANDGQPHAAGTFTMKYTGDASKDPFASLAAGEALTAKELCSTNYNIVKGGMKFTNPIAGGITPSGVVGNTFGSAFRNKPADLTEISGKYSEAGKSWDFEMTIDGVVYKGSVDEKKTADGKFKLYNTQSGDENDYIEMNRPSFDKITAAWVKENGGDGKKAEFSFTAPTAPLKAGEVVSIGGKDYAIPDDLGVRPGKFSFPNPVGGLSNTAQYTIGGTAYTFDGSGDAATSTAALIASINAGTEYTAALSADGNSIEITSKTDGLAASVPEVKDSSDAAVTAAKIDMGSNGDLSKQISGILKMINDDTAGTYTASFASGKFTLTAKEAKEINPAVDTPAVSFGGSAATVDTVSAGANTGKSKFADGASFDLDPTKVGSPSAEASKPSRALGLSSSAFILRGGTAGGAQTLADMTGIEIGSNGVITGWDKVGTPITIGRIDLATFANASGLNKVGSSNFGVSANSGNAILGTPGAGGAGQLVSGSLELSNVDLSREFSDMITTQRGYQANSRIVTVSDSMLEELINMKR